MHINSQKAGWLARSSRQNPPGLLVTCELAVKEPRWGLSGQFESFGFYQLHLLAEFPVLLYLLTSVFAATATLLLGLLIWIT